MPVEFRAFYQALYGSERHPFPWQERLAAQVEVGLMPPVLALPTSSGKTSVLEILVWALALQVGRSPAERSVPLRLFYVIDRRLVVDEVTAHARALAAKLAAAAKAEQADPKLRWVALQLLEYTQGVEAERCPLAVATMRGGMYRQDRWAERPDQPLICVSTVDQVGSRLLFHGYGLTPGRRPIHAGLIGFDTLVIVDEAHLSGPFCATLRQVAHLQAGAQELFAPPLRLLTMTATPDQPEAVPFALTQDDLEDEALGPRLKASKPARLLETADLIETSVREVRSLIEGEPDLQVIGVVLNRVDTARAVHRLLADTFPDQVLLLTGRIRPVDRDELLAEKRQYMEAKSTRPTHTPGPLILVATQTVEVGANLDFDALITEAAPLGALRQRFGRLNRLGRRTQSPAVILRRKEEKAEDPIYGPALAKSWDWLRAHARTEGKGKRAQQVIDLGVTALATPSAAEHRELQISLRHATLRRADVAILAETRPEPATVPDLAPFLHGCASGARADVLVVWRSDLTSENDGQWKEIVRRRPPLLREAMPVPLWAVQRWLGGKSEEAGAVSDLVGDPGATRVDKGRPVLRWRGPDDTAVIRPRRIRPGDTIVLPAAYGGADRFGWAPLEDEVVVDLADRCRAEVSIYRHGKTDRLTVSLHAAQADTFAEAVERRVFRARLARLIDLIGDELGKGDESVQRVVAELLAELPSHLQCLHSYLSVGTLDRLELYPDKEGVQLFFMVPPQAAPLTREETELLETETDEDERPPGVGKAIALRQHLDGVAALTERFARNLALPPGLVETLHFSAQYHDVGKLDHRFQAFLCGGDRVEAASLAEPLAKSGQEFPAHRQRQILDLSGYPARQRHEGQTAYHLAALPTLPSRVPEPTLCLGVVEGHHGWGRPLFPVPGHADETEVEALIEGEAVRVSSRHGLWQVSTPTMQRFHELNARFGFWGYAYLQAILRLADQLQSRLEAEGREEE